MVIKMITSVVIGTIIFEVGLLLVLFLWAMWRSHWQWKLEQWWLNRRLANGKPRISRDLLKRFWQCETMVDGIHRIGYGRTAIEAYGRWKRQGL